jgi:hypothetical protein
MFMADGRDMKRQFLVEIETQLHFLEASLNYLDNIAKCACAVCFSVLLSRYSGL